MKEAQPEERLTHAKEKQFIKNAADSFPSAELLALYSEVPMVHRNRLHYPILKEASGLTAIAYFQHVLQRFSGCCTVAELMNSTACDRATLFHVTMILQRDLWLSVIIRDLAECRAVISLRQDAVDAVTFTDPSKDIVPCRSVHASETFWRESLQYSHEDILEAQQTWLHFESIRPKYQQWWVSQILAGKGTP